MKNFMRTGSYILMHRHNTHKVLRCCPVAQHSKFRHYALLKNLSWCICVSHPSEFKYCAYMRVHVVQSNEGGVYIRLGSCLRLYEFQGSLIYKSRVF